MGNVTMKDLARELGVSVTTVSNAYSHPDRLSEKLREKIIATGEKLGYCGPDAVGRLLRSGKADAIGALCGGGYSSSFRDGYTMAMMAALSAELEKQGVALTMLPTGVAEDNIDAVANAVVDGFVSMSARTDSEAVKFAKRRGLKVVFGHMAPDEAFVSPDDFSGGHMLGELIARAGHKVVALVHSYASSDAPESVPDMQSFAPEGSSYHWGRTRAEGMREAMGPGVVIHYVQLPGKRMSDADCLDFLEQLEPRPTAWLAITDRVALALVDGLEARGLTPGVDISVTGFDGVRDCLERGITTIEQPIAEKGRRTAQLLLDPDATQTQIVLPVTLHEGTTVGPPKL